MENLIGLGSFFTGLGVFFVGVAALWWVSLGADRRKRGDDARHDERRAHEA